MANTKSRRNIRSKRSISRKNRSRKNRSSRRVKGGIFGIDFGVRKSMCQTRNDAIACDYAENKRADYRPIARCDTGNYEKKTIAELRDMKDIAEKLKWTQDLKCKLSLNSN